MFAPAPSEALFGQEKAQTLLGAKSQKQCNQDLNFFHWQDLLWSPNASVLKKLSNSSVSCCHFLSTDWLVCTCPLDTFDWFVMLQWPDLWHQSFETSFFCRCLQSLDKGPPGLHCFEGAQAQNSKPANFSTPQPCYQGRKSQGSAVIRMPLLSLCRFSFQGLQCVNLQEKIGGANFQFGIFMKRQTSPISISRSFVHLCTGFFCPPGSSTAYGAGACPLGPDPQIPTDVHRYSGGFFSTWTLFCFGFSGCRSLLWSNRSLCFGYQWLFAASCEKSH